jgi:hypothetical protein
MVIQAKGQLDVKIKFCNKPIIHILLAAMQLSFHSQDWQNRSRQILSYNYCDRAKKFLPFLFLW